jgi:small-conductance mechanosensitive channel
VRRLFARAAWLAGSEHLIALAIFAVVALYFLGVTAEINAMLDSVTFPIGKSQISLYTIGQGLVVVVVTIALTLWLSGFIERRLMATALDANTRVVLAKFLRAILIVLGVLVALPAIGIDLTLLSVFGGALGVGIGLGLQKLAANYIAGFTVVLDKSVKLGDLVTVDGRHGEVARFTSRYVVVRQLDGVEAIVPNETLVTTTVLNHSHATALMRLVVPLTVPYGTDLDRVLLLLVESARAQRSVLLSGERAPQAFVAGFGDSGIQIELTLWSSHAEGGAGPLRSALLRHVVDALGKAGIAIPPPGATSRFSRAPARRERRPTGGSRLRQPLKYKGLALMYGGAPTARPTFPGGCPGAVQWRPLPPDGRPTFQGALPNARFQCRAGVPRPRPRPADVVAGHRRRARDDARHDRVGDDLPAPLPGAPRARPAPDRLALLPLLAVADDRHGHQGVGGDPSQAPREGRDRGRSAQPGDARPQHGHVERRRAVPRRVAQPETLEHYGHGTPDDWLERNVYERFSWQGVGLMLALNVMLFGAIGATIWAVQMAWIPFFAAGVVNGLAHWWGYRNYATGDTSTNLVPWGLIIGGEELHNNHHAYGTSAKFSAQWYEVDLGWLYIRALSAVGLAKVRRVAPKLKLQASKPEADHARCRP